VQHRTERVERNFVFVLIVLNSVVLRLVPWCAISVSRLHWPSWLQESRLQERVLLVLCVALTSVIVRFMEAVGTVVHLVHMQW
jgi:hypothetical protein